jgi:hypothetical protein
MLAAVLSENQADEPPAIGVCHVTATAYPGVDISRLLVRLVMTLDVDSPQTATRHARGADQACRELRMWMGAMCLPVINDEPQVPADQDPDRI